MNKKLGGRLIIFHNQNECPPAIPAFFDRIAPLNSEDENKAVATDNKSDAKTRLVDIAADLASPSTPLNKQQAAPNPNAHSQLASSLNTSPSTAALIHKSNGTPTTSILKKRLLECKAAKKLVNMSSAAALLLEEGGTQRWVIESLAIEN